MSGENLVVVFTANGPKQILHDRGSQAWVLDKVRAGNCSHVLLTQNRKNRDHLYLEKPAPHGAGFLLGKIAAIEPTTLDDVPDRWLIRISEYAEVDLLNAWGGWRNPVRYDSLDNFGIDLNDYTFQPMPVSAPAPRLLRAAPIVPTAAKPMTITRAKALLADAYGVQPDAVEITIRG